MKKRIIASLICLLPLLLYAQDSLYAIKFRDLYGRETAMAAFRGKKIIVAIVSASDPDKQLLLSLDSLYRNNRSAMGIIAVPAVDFGDTLPVAALQSYFKTLYLRYSIAMPARTKKNAGETQQELVKWLTHKTANQHLDEDIVEQGQMYVINEKGVVYAMLKNKTSPMGKFMKRVLDQHTGH